MTLSLRRRRTLLALPLAASLPLAAPRRALSATTRPDPTLLRGRVAELIGRGDARLDTLSRPQNLAYAGTRPLAIARCAEPAHVASAITWAQENRVPFVLRSGGHSYAGCSVTDGLLVDMRPMSRIRVERDGTVTLGGGVLNHDVYASLRAHDLMVTHGRCGGVGASAFLMGGGIGFAMRDRGMGCDAVRAVSLVLADGTEVRASEGDELFWAVRGGGGGNLGAATQWILAPFPAEPVTMFDLAWRDADPALFLTLARALEAAPDRLGSKVTVFAPDRRHGGTPRLTLLGQLRGPHEEAMAILQPVLRARPATGRVETMAYWDAQALLSEEGDPAYYRETSRFTGHLPEALAEEAFRRLRNWPGTSGEALFKMFQVGGRIRAKAPGDTAYVHRDAEWLTGTEITWGAGDSPARVEAALAWQRAFHWASDALAGAPGGSFQNFVDPGLEDPAEAYYGANRQRLAALRARLDPNGAFAPPRRQGIA
ncbi:FAD-binding oxidoreductase [Sabulicella rubraurantiaca]|uniref:FAD-binding oxidoreductase n=1 Tax=Sabulicella rubraurantiaca TaxID=2811429 RepID=UPI001A96B2D6|nr:FAD-binding oxidoreductase [Sabulicella rubraurantiaca]